MIKFTATRTATGVTIVGLGLSRENCERLLRDEPIIVRLAEMGVAGAEAVEVMIFAGETEAAMAERLRRLGLIDRGTVIRGEP